MATSNLRQNSVSDKQLQNIIKIIIIPLKYSYYSHKIPKTYLFSAFLGTFTHKNSQIRTTNWIYKKTQYVQLKLFPSPEHFTRTRFAWFATNRNSGLSQTFRGRELTFWENVHPPPCVTYHVSHFRCQVSGVLSCVIYIYIYIFFFFCRI